MGMVGGMIDGAEVDCFHGKKCRPESVDEMNTRKERAKGEEKIAKTHHKKITLTNTPQRMPPSTTIDDLSTLFLSGMWRLHYRLSHEGKRRFFNEFLPLLHDTKAATLGARDPRSWYLVYIGACARGRGKGNASKLIRHVTAQADRDGVPIYLESSNERNPPIYRRFGFETVRRVYLQRAEGNVCMDIMVREGKGGKK